MTVAPSRSSPSMQRFTAGRLLVGFGTVQRWGPLLPASDARERRAITGLAVRPIGAVPKSGFAIGGSLMDAAGGSSTRGPIQQVGEERGELRRTRLVEIADTEIAEIRGDLGGGSGRAQHHDHLGVVG